MSERFDAAPVLVGLTAFQRATVRHVMDRYFGDEPTRRFLTADETGLGKSLVARGVIASIIERLQDDDAIDRIDIVYVCSNADIAEQNITRLNVTGEDHLPFASRLTLLAKESHRLTGGAVTGTKPVNLVSFTPGTSFAKGHTGGRAEERALLYLLLRDQLGLDRRQQRRARILLRFHKGKVNFDRTIDRLERHVELRGELDPVIVQQFGLEASEAGLLDRFEAMNERIGQRQYLLDDEWEPCRSLIGELRNKLARASIDCLEPDLVILDEFQRFRHLLDRDEGGDAAELAHDLFDHTDSRVLLLSATPYKPFTYAEEQVDGDEHQRDFLATIRFLAAGNEPAVDAIREGFARLRSAAVTGGDPSALTADLRDQLLRFMCRTERPQSGVPDMLAERPLPADALDPQDLIDFAVIRALARTLETPFQVEYWKSAPYFLNFSEGYRLGSDVRSALDTAGAPHLEPMLERARTLSRAAVEGGQPFDPGNARLRALMDDTVERDWWRLLWMPPSLPYFDPAGPYAEIEPGSMTKRLVFSSWTATPTALATILSHHAQRHTLPRDIPASGRLARRLDFRVVDDEAKAMNNLVLFWPNPALASVADPLKVAADLGAEPRPVGEVAAVVTESLGASIGPDGATRGTAAEAWYWIAPFRMTGAVPAGLTDDVHQLTQALAGELRAVSAEDGDDDGRPDPQRLRLHVEQALDAGGVVEPPQRPDDLVGTVAQIGLHAPGNLAWRALGRQLGPGHSVTPAGHWVAAATIASAFRSLFNRPDVSTLLDSLPLGSDVVYWRAVLAYCAAGNLQAVLDEYLHHLAGSRGPEPLDDPALLELAVKVHDAVAMRPAPYTAFDPLQPDEPISFSARFALRYGNKRQTEGDVRQPLVRNAFNSPFWPFVLATTSVGQEGIDLHWWCHAVVHWNTPASPVDFDQREGRVHRYGGHAIRKNVAAAHRREMLAAGVRDPWEAGYEAATELQDELGDLSPHWVYPGPASIERITTPYPLSIDHDRLQRIKDDVALYRLTLGQPRQEDLVDLLRRQGVQADVEQAEGLRLDLSPPKLGADVG